MGENLVDEFMPEALRTPQEIDIDLFVQDYLGMEQDFQYLSHCGESFKFCVNRKN